MKLASRLILLLWALGSHCWAWAQEPPAATNTNIQEFVVGVSSIDRVLPAFTRVFKWKVRHDGDLSPDTAALWGLPAQARGREVVVGNAASVYGFVRLVEIKGVEREIIRQGARWWDTGGVLNINVLVKDLDATISGLRAMGFTADSFPNSYSYPDGRNGRMAIMRGPDDLMLSFQQRIAPPLTTFGEFEGATHIEIGYQILKDLEAWRRFHVDVLGLPSGPIREAKNEKPIGPNDYGLPHNIVGGTDGRTLVVKPHAGSEQGLGGRQFGTSTGHDFEERVKPWNLGITTVRFAVKDLDDLLARVKASGVSIETPLQAILLPPYGKVRLFTLRTPGGSGTRLEFHDAPSAHQAGTKSTSKDPLAPKTDGKESNISRLSTITVVTRDLDATSRFYRDGLAMRQTGPIASSAHQRARLRGLWGIPSDADWVEYHFDRPGAAEAALVRVLVLDRDTPAIRPEWSGQREGSLSIGFSIRDMEGTVSRVSRAGFGTTAGVSDLKLVRPEDGSTYIVQEVHFKAPETIYGLGVARPHDLPPISPLDPATGIGGPAYSGLTVMDSDRTISFLTDALGLEVRRDVVFKSSGPKGGLALPEGTAFRFVQVFAPGASTGYLVLLDMQDKSLRRQVEPRPPYRGVAMWTFMVKDMEKAIERLRVNGAPIAHGPVLLNHPPYGPHRSLTTIMPNGFLVELVEPKP